MEDAINVLRQASLGPVTYHSERIHLDDLAIEPRARQSPLPIWVTSNPDLAKPANVERGLRRVARLGDGWMVGSHTAEDVAHLSGQLDSYLVEHRGQVPPEFVKSLYYNVVGAITATALRSFYNRSLDTSRRATAPTKGVGWVHGSDVGVASSDDRGATWCYRGVLDLDHDFGRNTFWAPEVTWANGVYHVFVSYVRGVPDQWAGHPRHIHHYISEDLVNWDHRGPLALSSDRVIDAAVHPHPGGGYPDVVQGRGRRRQHVVSRQS